LFSFDGLSVACTYFVEFGCDELIYGSYFEKLLNQGLVMANDTCEATICNAPIPQVRGRYGDVHTQGGKPSRVR